MDARRVSERLRRAREIAREQGVGALARRAGDRVWSTQVFLGLRCRLEDLPPVRPAGVPIALEPVDASFAGFTHELAEAGDDDSMLHQRQAWLEAGAATWYAAFDDGNPVYAQLLARWDDPEALRALGAPGNGLAPGEGMLEGAYTFRAYRRRGVMGDAMAQLLRIARAQGLESVITFVEPDNVGSLRGCAAVGFGLDHRRVIRRRFFGQRNTKSAPQPRDRAGWEAATAGAGKTRPPRVGR